MATESIFTSINIDTPQKAARFITALEEAQQRARQFKIIQASDNAVQQKVKKYFGNEQKWLGAKV
ncbi:hypothetical protein IJJ08_00965 [bacterium]|nr:hypothetical protein [bacterium]